jgi:hypothetical protein
LWKKIHVTKFENLQIYVKTRVVNGILGFFYSGEQYWYTSIKSRTILKLNFLDKIPL